MKGAMGAPGNQGPPGPAGRDAEFDFSHIEVMVANTLWKKLMKPSEYCGENTEMCKCGEVAVVTRPPPVQVVKKPVLDIIFLVDGSDSVSVQDWVKLREWVVQLVGTYKNEFYREKFDKISAMLVIQYSSHGLRGDAATPGYVLNKAVLAQVNQLQRELQSMIQMAAGTDTYMALEFVVDNVLPEMVREQRLPAGTKHVRQLILLTNGIARDEDINRLYNTRSHTNVELQAKLDSSFYSRFVIGVGSEIGMDDRQVKYFAGDAESIWLVDDMSQLNEVTYDLSAKMRSSLEADMQPVMMQQQQSYWK